MTVNFAKNLRRSFEKESVQIEETCIYDEWLLSKQERYILMEGLLEWIRGNLSTNGRLWSSLLPAIVLVSYFVIGMIVYAIRTKFRGQLQDHDMESKASSVLLGKWIHLYFIWVTKPLWFLLLRCKIPAAAVTTLSLLVAIGSGISIAAGHFALGGWLYLFSGMLDIFDGRLARAQGTPTPGGAALDSVLDRYSDGAVLIGFAWFYRDSWVLLAVLTAMLGSMMVSYVRARGEGLGVDVKVGLMQRAERIVYLGVATTFSPILEAVLAPNDPQPIHRLAVAGIVLLAVSTQLTALRRFMYLLTALGNNPLGGMLQTGHGSFFRNQVAALVATAADFLLVLALVANAGVFPWFATIVGCGLGAVVNFSINRIWAFKSAGSLLPQISRYSFVSLTSALLNGGGVAIILLLPSLDYRLAWIVVRVMVALVWNYPLQRDYVFSTIHSSSADRGLHGAHSAKRA